MSLLIKNAKIFDHADADRLLIEDGKIKAINPPTASADEEIDCQGYQLLPSLIDMQVFAQDDFADLDQAACAGGVSSALVIPTNAQPFITRPTEPTKTNFIYAAPITYQDSDGTGKLAEIGLAYRAGARFFCNGNAPITNSELMRQAMSYVADMDATLIHQPQEPSLAHRGMMNEGVVSARLGLKGIPHQAETVMLARDIELVRLTGCRYHAAQLSTKGGVEMVRRAKQEGLSVSCGVSIHHLLLTEAAIGDFRTFCKLTPPLRTEQDRQALIAGVKEGVIETITSSHNPQSQETKRLPFALAEGGSVGLETLLAAAFILHERENIPLAVLMRALTAKTAKLAEGSRADLICYNPDAPWVLDVAQFPFRGKSQNDALDGGQFYGKIMMTFLEGEIVFDARSN